MFLDNLNTNELRALVSKILAPEMYHRFLEAFCPSGNSAPSVPGETCLGIV